MCDSRLKAWEVYENTPMPTTSDEEWRRTSLRRVKLDQLGPSVNGDAASGVEIPEFLGGQLTEDEAGGNMLQIDGVIGGVGGVLVFLQNITGFMVGKEAEAGGKARQVAMGATAVPSATTPPASTATPTAGTGPSATPGVPTPNPATPVSSPTGTAATPTPTPATPGSTAVYAPSGR